ncbi:leucyl/phenylalanyl-tRNA--protein transferase [Nocardioides insulae]|uniref:leucyl/phenylalanyl-tRNA--protein transferase n=1 Tax=Nocardioides insulae TaxID=394734 RepID=UPI0003F93DFD|nr:leucyl/phenylalanyl-tRNA--protein transferase [Nocardioides insulae]
MPVEPPPSQWSFSVPDEDGLDDLVGMGADLAPGTLLAAYRHGLFPMPGPRRRDPLLWFSPVERGILPLDGLRVSRSLRRATRDFEIRIDTDFEAVVERCADPSRPQGWIDEPIRAAYAELHRLGWAHSVETWQQGRLVGGLYGVAIGGLFAGESMFHHARDASKVALVALVDLLLEGPADEVGSRLLDVQWTTPHLASLGVVEVPREEYLQRLAIARDLSLPRVFGGTRGEAARRDGFGAH